MKREKIKRLEKLLERKLTETEVERLRRIHDVLGIADNDSLWDILTAMEYQRVYYDELPQKIAGASAEILRDISGAAEKEMQRAQGRLAESVAEQAQRLSVRMNMATLLPLGICALICLLAYGALLLWAGFCLGAGQAHSPALILRMPAGVLMGGLGLAGGVFLGIQAGRKFAEGGKGWQKQMLIALAMLIIGGVLFSLGVG
jgi:hypothetical protein